MTFADCAESVRADIDAAGFDDIVLAGHSLAGCSMPAMIGLLGDRVRHAVFIACTVPETGKSAFDTLDPEVQAMARAGMEAAGDAEPRAMDGELAKLVLGNDLTDEQLAFCVERLVAEAPGLSDSPVDLAPLRPDLPSTWVRTLQDMIVAARQAVAVREERGSELPRARPRRRAHVHGRSARAHRRDPRRDRDRRQSG